MIRIERQILERWVAGKVAQMKLPQGAYMMMTIGGQTVEIGQPPP
jgi:hypothetical protein